MFYNLKFTLAMRLLSTLLLLFALALPASSFTESIERRAIYTTLAASEISARDAASIAKRKYGGKVLSVKNDGSGNFQVKLLQDSGRVMIVTVTSRGQVRG